MKSAALQYARNGWHVFPVGGDKMPLVERWPQRATSDETVIEAWWDKWPDASIGAIPASAGLLAVDYDTKSGKSVAELRDALASALGIDLPGTGLIARSPSGGEHHYYKIDEPVASSNSKLVKGADIRSAKNGYILLPPSLGGKYVWLKSGVPAVMPTEACERFGKMGDTTSERPAWNIEPDQPDNVALARKWLEDDARPSVEGRGGNQALYDTACMMVSFAVSQEKALELLLDVYNPAKCVPQWDAGDVARTISNAYRYHTSDAGNMTPGYRAAKLGFSPLLPQEQVTNLVTLGTDYFRITDSEQIRELPPPRWLIDPYLQEETCAILTGEYGSFKSFVALDMALSVATGAASSVWDTTLKGCLLYTSPSPRDS